MSQESDSLQLKLDVIAGPHQGRSFTRIGHENFLVGRSDRAHFRLPRADQLFSRLHFMIETNPPCCRLFDMNSTNGTMVNGERVTTIDLRDGDLIQGGDTVIKVSLIGDWTTVREMATTPQQETQARESIDGGFGEEHTRTFQPASGAPTAATKYLPDEPDKKFPAIDGYRVLRELGRGAMGVVYLAMSEADQRHVAIKTIRPAIVISSQEVDRFFREIDILKQLRHPKIVGFQESGETAGLLYFVMEYVPGDNAAAMVKRRGPLPIGQVVHIVCQVLEALDYAHSQGFVHRDVKPANLLVEDGGECKLADFGLARVYYASSMSGLTMTGQVGGTLPFMPPEQITDYRRAKPHTDQYAAAATLYHLLTGEYLFDFFDLPAVARLTKILMEDPIPIVKRRPDVPKVLADAIHRGLAREAQDRFASCAELRQSLLQFAG